MNKQIARNIAIVSAIFMVSFSIMLVTNYFQVRGTTPLQAEVVETLKQLNDQNPNNTALQEQIRQLDLMARKAYFVRMDHLMMGVYLLIGMLVTFVVSLRIYYANYKEIPDKEIDPIDEWAIKSKARRYLIGGASALAAVALLFVVLTSPYLKSFSEEEETALLTQADGEGQPVDAYDSDGRFDESASAGEGASDAETIESEEGSSAALLADATATENAETTGTTGAESTATASGVATAGTSQEGATSSATAEVVKPTNASFNGFRGNTSNGLSAAKNIPTKWNLSAKTNILWQFKAPRKGYNSPVINGNRIFFSGADAEARELYCYDLASGKELWTLAAKGIAGSPAQMPHTTDDTGLAASTVATNGTQVCAVFATGDIICADMEGKQLWAKNLGVPENHYGYASSLLIAGETVYIQYDNENASKVVALNVNTGAERWSKARKEKSTWSSPILATVGNSRQLVLMGNPNIIAYNPGNGQELWSVNCLSGEVGASASSANGIIYGASEYSKMVAINGADGSVLWESKEFLPEVSSPVATKENVYLATSYGVVASFDTQTGDLRKEHDLGVEFYSSPVIAEGKLFVISNSGKVHVFAANNDFPLLDSFETGEKTFATPAFTDGKIVVRTESSIYCVAAN